MLARGQGFLDAVPRRVRSLAVDRTDRLIPVGYNQGMPGHDKTFFLETFGCQMNVHDSEKVAGTLIAQGYSQVDDPRAADLVLYNTCSIRDKAEQKVFSRLGQ